LLSAAKLTYTPYLFRGGVERPLRVDYYRIDTDSKEEVIIYQCILSLEILD